MNFFRLTHLSVLCLFITQAFAWDLVRFRDGYAWQNFDQTSDISHSSQSYVKFMAKNGYRAMVADARQYYNMSMQVVPSVMAALFIPNQRGGLSLLASSIKPVRHGRTSENHCSADPSVSENCAEMRALALALKKLKSITCKGSVVAVYGLQGNNATYMAPCRDRNGLWSCGSYCKQSEMTIVSPE